MSIHSETEPPLTGGYQRLFGETLLPVCAPGLIERGPRLSDPGDLADHVLLCSLNRPLDWPTWLAAAGVDRIDGNSGLKFENAALAYQAVTDQLGIMIAQHALVADDLRTGRLVAPFSLRVATSGAYYLACRADRPKSARIQAFEDWIMREVAVVE